MDTKGQAESEPVHDVCYDYWCCPSSLIRYMCGGCHDSNAVPEDVATGRCCEQFVCLPPEDADAMSDAVLDVVDDALTAGDVPGDRGYLPEDAAGEDAADAGCPEQITGHVIDAQQLCASREENVLGCRDREAYPGELASYGCYVDESHEVIVFTWHLFMELEEQGWQHCDEELRMDFLSRDTSLWFCPPS